MFFNNKKKDDNKRKYYTGSRSRLNNSTDNHSDIDMFSGVRIFVYIIASFTVMCFIGGIVLMVVGFNALKEMKDTHQENREQVIQHCTELTNDRGHAWSSDEWYAAFDSCFEHINRYGIDNVDRN